jgi:hypothetical protein
MLVDAWWCDELRQSLQQLDGFEDEFGVTIECRLAQVIDECRFVELFEPLGTQGWACAVAHQSLESLAIPFGDAHRGVHRPATGMLGCVHAVDCSPVQVTMALQKP